MASYFQSYFLASTVPKRLIQYVLTKSDILDTETLNLDNLDIAWGKDSTFEFKDVGLRLKKLDALLQLPPNLEFARAKVLRIRLTIPVDIFNSPIQVDVDGVEGHLRVRPKSEKFTANTYRTDHDRLHKQHFKSSVPSAYSKASGKRRGSDLGHGGNATIPTAEDLAQSFMQTEPEEEIAELEAAILSETQEVGTSSILSEDGEIPMGTGTNLTLPKFMANFLEGIYKRLQVRIHEITINLDIDIPAENPKLQSATDPVTVQLKIEDIDIEGIPPGLATALGEDPGKYSKEGKKLITLSNIRGCLITESNFFSSLAHSTLSSPSTVHTGNFGQKTLFKAESSARESFLGGFDCDTSSEGDSLAASSQFLPTASSRQVAHLDLLSNSVVASDNGRFEDAPDEDNASTMSGSVRFGEAGDSVFRSSAYLDQMQSQYSNRELSERETSIQGSLRGFPPPAASPLTTPRASLHISSAEIEAHGWDAPSAETPSNPMLQSAMLPNRHFSRFSDSRISRSQPTITENSSSIIRGSRASSAEEMLPARAVIDTSMSSDEDEDSPRPLGESLMESQLFSHEEAESMYMSAISHVSSHSPIPSSFSGELDQFGNDGQVSIHTSMHEPLDNLAHARNASPIGEPVEQDDDKGDGNHSNSSKLKSTTLRSISPHSPPNNQDPSPNPVPHTSSSISENSRSSSEDFSRLSKQFFTIDHVRVYLPALIRKDLYEEPEITINTSTHGSRRDASQSDNMPGAFSTHLPVYSPPRVPAAAAKPKPRKATEDQSSEMEVLIEKIGAQFDVSIARLMFKLVDQLKEALKQSPSPATKPSISTDSKLSLSVNGISAMFLERLEGTVGSENDESTRDSLTVSSADVLLRASLKGLQVKSATANSVVKTSVTLKKFSFGYVQEDIVSFDSGLQMGASVRDLSADAGIDVSISVIQVAGTSRCEINTLPVHVTIDLQRLDETFSWFGGLSGVLNLGSSMVSNTTITAGLPSKPKPRGVRFEAPIRPDDKSVVSQNKADVRIGGFMLDLVGTECWIGLRSSAVKLVSREEGIGITIQKTKLTGPHLRGRDEDPAITADVTGTRIEFHPSPKHGDLELLLSLITPSKAKYDQDDDLILDTLLRQRKQGSVLRLTIDDFQTSISKLHQLSYLPELGEEVARLATVAKYLPDDERPGMLSLIIVNRFGANIDVGNTVGTVQLVSTDINVAQITLPALIALSIGGVSARRNGSEELLGFATEPESREEKLPCIMARMIGDEMDPVVKIKLWNLKIEYRVPTLIALLGLAQDATAQDMSASVAESVATLTNVARAKTPGHDPRQASSSSPSKPLAIDIVLRDCVLGLNPSGLPSKMLVVLTEARSTIVVPKDGNSKASLELSKASLLVVDNVAYLTSGISNIMNRRQSFNGVQVADLCAMGFVSVSYICSAKAIVEITKSEGDTSIDVELRDDMFVLESCADSTQTIVAILNGLSPPTPPSKEIKYRTKVIPVHDLLASLSGDAFGTVEGGNFNVTDDFELAESLGGDSTDDHEYDLEEHDFDDDDQYDAAALEDLEQSIASMHLTSRDTNDGVLLASFVEPVAAEEVEELDFQEDHFGTGSILEGTAHRWNSAKNTYDHSNVQKLRRSPLKVCIRDVHIIWNLFDGYDWQDTRDAISRAVHDAESKAIEKRSRNDRRPGFDQDLEDDETEIGDFLFNSIYIGIPSHREPGYLADAINFEINDNATETESVATTTLSASPSRQGSSRGAKPKKLRLNRSRHHKISFELRGVSVDVVTFPPGSGETQNSIDVRVRDLEVFDHMPTSTWRKFATCMQDSRERETGTSMFHIEILNVRPVANLAAAELVVKVTVLPLRLHVDQDALDFITRFFEFKDDSAPVQTSVGDPPFLQRVEVNAIQVKLDFKPRRVDYAGLRSGRTTEFMNFVILDEADMVMRHTIIYGVSGFEKLGKCLNDIWMPDIKRNQLPGILAGIAPIRSIVNVVSGLDNIVIVPYREYKKDGRIVRSVSKGAAAFARTTGTELVKLGAKVAIGIQTVLQGAEDFLGPIAEHGDMSADSEDNDVESRHISHYANQPVGVLQGLRGGYAGLQRDLLLARDAIIAVPGEVMEGGNAAGVLMAVRKHAPTVILRPAIGVSRATGQALMGAMNSLDPKNMRKVEDKYKSH